MKGRPLTAEEFDRLLETVPQVVGTEAAASWCFLLRGISNTGLRLTELMTISWDLPQTIQPRFEPGRLPVLSFPGYAQKNGKHQDVPLCPWFEDQLAEVPPEARTGYIFTPTPLQIGYGRPYRGQRLTAERVGKIISRIGAAAGIIVDDGDPTTGRPAKYASAHDLRRMFAQRLADAGLPPDLTRKLMRHEDITTTQRYYQTQNVQRDGERLRELVTLTPPPRPARTARRRKTARPALRIVG
jgi:integrase